MKREHPNAAREGGECSAAAETGKGKMTCKEEENDGGVDELLAVLGYKVRASDMADVAQKLEQLEMALGTGVAAPNDDPSFLPNPISDTVHYNPSDLSTWLDSMLSELNAPPPPLPGPPTSAQPPVAAAAAQQYPFDLPPFPEACDAGGIAAIVDFPAISHRPNPVSSTLAPAGSRLMYGSPDSQSEITSHRDPKRMRTATCSASSSTSRSRTIGEAMTGAGSSTEVASSLRSAAGPSPEPLSVVVLDTQEAGIRLVHALMACAEAVQQENLKAADALVKQISVLAASQSGSMRKVASFFAEGLASRIYKLRPHPGFALNSAFDDLLHMHFYESCPYLKFAHFTANQAILEAFAGCRRVHVIDFGMKQGMQWPALLQALALRTGGPPSFRLTGIGRPQQDNSDALQRVGWKLAQLAETINVDFQYRGLVAKSLADLEPRVLLESPSGKGAGDDDACSEPEAVAVNSVCELHRLLARPREVEKVLGTVRSVRPRIVTVVEQEANHNTGSFLERFTEALHYYSTMFDSLEGGAAGCSVAIPGDTGVPGVQAQQQQLQQDQVLAEVYLGRQICNVVASEGAERTERHETLAQWRRRMARAGFEPAHLGSNAFKQASMLLALYAGGEGYRVEENDGCLTLGWHTRPLIATSAWRLVDSGGASPVSAAVVAR